MVTLHIFVDKFSEHASSWLPYYLFKIPLNFKCANISTFTVFNQLLDFCLVLPESLISYNDGIFVAIDVVKKLLTVDPKKRATLEEVISHPWFKVTVFCIFLKFNEGPFLP